MSLTEPVMPLTHTGIPIFAFIYACYAYWTDTQVPLGTAERHSAF
jgi:hypothetical protein